MRVFLALLGLLLAFSSAVTAESELSAVIGETKIILPCPKNLVEVGASNRRAFSVPAQNRLLAAFVEPECLKHVQANNIDMCSNQVMVQTFRNTENRSFSNQEFKSLVTSLKGKQLQELSKSTEEINKVLRSYSGDASPQIESPVFLATILDNFDAYATTFLFQTKQPNFPQKKALATNGLIRIRGRIMFLYFYFGYVNETSYQHLCDASKSYIEEIIIDNK